MKSLRQQPPRLVAFVAKKRAERRKKPSSSLLSESDNDLRAFGHRQGLTLKQALLAERLLRRAEAKRRVTGFRYALRVGGIVSAVKRGLVGNSGWGRSMLASRGGRVMKDHGLSTLRAISPAGVRASVIARERRKARERWESSRDPRYTGGA
jgi:hypothetical protein